jgi:hypothetical protein
MIRYWISWWQPGDDPRPLHYPPKNEKVLGWWESGHEFGNGRTSICALIRAESPSLAMLAVADDWPESVNAEWRFVEEVPGEWSTGTRFPLADWMKARIEGASK